jgi:signal transduction histidine kinase
LVEPLRLQGVKVSMELAEELPRVAGVATQLEQLLVKLVNNARDAMSETPRKELTLRACPDGGRVRLEVEDSGCGMDEAVRGRLFEKFFTTKESDSGTGLGMTVVEEVIRAHQAELQVHSEPGAGTCFQIWLLLDGPQKHSPPQASHRA